ncbi:MAG TPA: putative toxin-antitoxin system toxin component, PIN family [Thermoanaerobaculia bacterium]|jgi:putative PIN family toxin of toxin-antitoxin system
MRAVIDTNILVRARLKPEGTVGPVLDLLRDGRYVFLYSETTLEELLEVLTRPRMVHKYGLTADDIEALSDLLIVRGEAVDPEDTFPVCRDPKDDKFLHVAVAGRADVVVTGDEDLLVLHPFRDIPIVGPRQFLEMLAA